MKVYFADTQLQPLPQGHRFPMGKYEGLKSLLQAGLPGIECLPSRKVSLGELALVHTPRYIEDVLLNRLSKAQQLAIGFPWSQGMVDRAMFSVGASIMAAQRAWQEGISANLAGGTHHAYADQGGGFCVFNDVAVATKVLQAQVRPRGRAMPKVLLLDLDVHQGNGNAKIFENNPSVFTFSMHGAQNYPLRKEKSDWDIDLADGTEDGSYLQTLSEALDKLEDRFNPDFVFYLAGADPYKGDRLGRLALTQEGLRQRDRMVLSWVLGLQCPLAMVMAGGYGVNMQETLQIQFNSFELAHKAWQAFDGLPQRVKMGL